MKKIQLDLNHLDVQSFDTTPRLANGAGTVLGHGTVGPEASCAVSWCGCQTGDDPACVGGGTGDCDSVNPMGCQSAGYTDCCESQGWTDCCPSEWWTDCCWGPGESTDPFDGDCT